MLLEVGPEWGGDVRAEVEHLVLDLAEVLGQRPGWKRGDGSADRAIGFVDLTNRRHARARFRDAAAVDKPSFAVVAGAGVDLVELDHRRMSGRASPARRWRASG